MANPFLSTYLEKNPKTHLIFDFDETLAWLKIDWPQRYQALTEIYQTYEADYDYESQQFDIGYNQYARKYGAEFAKKIDEFYQAFELEHLSEIEPYPELVSLIKKWAQDGTYQLYLYTSNTRPTIESALTKLGLENCFSKTVTRSDVQLIKPDPEGFGLIYEPGQDKEQYLMVGNSSSDEGMAQAAGIDFYEVDYFA